MPFPPRSARFTLILLASLTVMSGATLAPALPTMAAHFAETDTANTGLWVRLVLTGPALSIALCAWGVGMLLDRVGRLRPLWAALLLYAGAGSAGLWLDSLPGLVLSRLALGVAVAVVMTACTALVGDVFQGSQRERFLSRQAAFMGYGGVVFLTLGGVLAGIHWRAPFAVYGLSIPILLLAWITLRPIFAHQSPGVAHSVPESPVLGAVQAAPSWLPMVLHLFATITFIGFYQVPSQLPFLLTALDPATPPWMVGGVVASLNLVGASTAMAYGRVRRHWRYQQIMGGALALLACGLAGISAAGWLGNHGPLPPLAWAWIATAVAGLGLGLAMPNMTVWLLSVTPAATRGRAAGGQTAGVFLGQFSAPLLAQPLGHWGGGDAAFAGAALLMALTAGGCFLLNSGDARA
jgi:MFS family permease